MFRKILLILSIVASSTLLWGQDDVITPENAERKREEQKEKIVKEYQDKVEKHKKAQGKKKYREMKRNEKAQKKLHSGRNLPWYKRIFRRRKR